MKLNHVLRMRALPLLTAILPCLTAASTVTVGGYVPERRNITVTPVHDPSPSDPSGTREVAVIEIDNNLPDYSLVLDFTDGGGERDLISGVRLQPVEGTLGRGLTAPDAAVLAPEDEGGRFVWSPGVQQSATLNYRMRVYVTYKRPLAAQPLLIVGMPSAL